MGRSAVSVRQEGCGSTVLDRSPERRDSPAEDLTTDRRAEAAGGGGVLSAVGKADETQATSQNAEGQVDLHDLWFALPRHEQEQFGGYFSAMLMRVVQQQAGSSSHSESTS